MRSGSFTTGKNNFTYLVGAGRMGHGTLIGLACFSLLPVATIVHHVPLAETIIASAGMFFIVFVYLQAAIAESHKEYALLQTASRSMEDILHDNCKYYRLTPREAQVVERLVTGLPYKIVAAELDISEKTVSRHVDNTFVKVGVSNKTELVHHLRQPLRTCTDGLLTYRVMAKIKLSVPDSSGNRSTISRSVQLRLPDVNGTDLSLNKGLDTT